jgi:CO/xanthine dehydrogenase Mo-binding subunit
VVAEPDGSFTAYVGVASVGQGVQTVLSQIAADVLEVPIERIRIDYFDTSQTPEGQGAFSSRSTVWGGYAIAGAIHVMRENALAVAAERLEIAPSDLELTAGGMVSPRGDPGHGIALAELGVEGFFRYEPAGGSDILVGGNVCLVRVDPESGGVELLRFVIAYEIGRAINPQTLEGQTRGGAVQGIGGALLEDFAYGPDGQPLATSFMDYALPTAAESPDIDVILVELGETSSTDPIKGAKGGGEGGIIAIGATVVNAVADAIGPRGGELTFLPLTPESVQRVAGAGA